MPEAVKTRPSTREVSESSFLSLLSGWVQQGVENFFATQRILVDLAVRQNAAAMRIVRERLADPEFCPSAIASELAGEGVSNLIHGQKLLLELAKQETDIVMGGIRDRVSGSNGAVAAADLVKRSVGTMIGMQQEFLKLASKQTNAWLDSVAKGKPFDGEQLITLAREGMETFIEAQKKFLDVIAEEVTSATSGRPHPVKKEKIADLSELARKATEAFVEAQKKLMDVAGKQVNANLKATGRVMNMVKPFPFIPLPDMTREGVRSFVDAEKQLIDSMKKSHGGSKAPARGPRGKRKARPAKAHAAAAGA